MWNSRHARDSNLSEKTCAHNLIVACNQAKSLHERSQEFERYEHMKEEIKEQNDLDLENFPDVEDRLGNRIKEMKEENEDLSQRLKDTESTFSKQAIAKLMVASDPSRYLRKFEIPTERQVKTKLATDFLLNTRIPDLRQKASIMISSKLNKSELPAVLNLVDDADQYIQEFIHASVCQYKEESKDQMEAIAIYSKRLEYIASKEYTENIVSGVLSKVMMAAKDQGLDRQLGRSNLSKLTLKALEEHLGEQVMKQVARALRGETDIYPTNSKDTRLSPECIAKIRKSRIEKRLIKASRSKIQKMNKEATMSLSILENSLLSFPTKHLFEHMEHIDEVTKNHQEILEFINAPEGTFNEERHSTPLDMRHEIPSNVNLFPLDGLISSAFATSLIQQTKVDYFADLEARLKALEEKI